MKEMIQDEIFSRERQHYYKQVLDAAGTGEPIRIPSGDITAISYQFDGDGTVEVTGYPVADILDDTAVWVEVLEGDGINPSVTAIRQTNASGTTVLNLRVQ